MSELSTFWDEKKKRSELHLKGVVLYGENSDSMFVMSYILKLEEEVSGLKKALSKIDDVVGHEMTRWVWQ